MEINKTVWVIIVTYFPKEVEIDRLSAALKSVGVSYLFVDNTGTNGALFSTVDANSKILNRSNIGIAAAQNQGIRHAINSGASVLVFLDQDTNISAATIRELIRPLVMGVPCVTATLSRDAESGFEMPAYRVDALGLPRKVFAASTETEPYPVDLVISSGMAMTTQVISTVGSMDTRLFIDFVDFEWCFRCKSKSIPIKVVPAAQIDHKIGIRAITVSRFSGALHSPHRTYYKVRNPFLLLRRPWVPKMYAFREIVAAILINCLSLRVVSEKLGYAKKIFAGVWDGVRNVDGIDPRLADRR